VLDAGINYIDTSVDYGLSEERIGRYIGHRRSEYHLASKCGCLVGATQAPPGQRNALVFTRDNILKSVEHSLARMRTDRLDDLLEGMGPMEFTLRFTFTDPDLDTTIVRTVNQAHLQANLDVLHDGPLPSDVYEEAKRRLANAGSVPRSVRE
jgi:aryl-alcohol dehydrogenase-like predicted oxidoreductase